MSSSKKEDIRKNLKTAEARLSKITNINGDHLGKAFLKAVKDSGAHDDFSKKVHDIAAAYIPYDTKARFVNTLCYSSAARTNTDRFTLSKLHESIHAVQFSEVPALHIDFNNRAFGNLILTPRDFIKLRILAEAQAQALEAYMGALMWEQGLTEARDSPAFTILHPHDVLNIMRNARNEDEGLAGIALKTLGQPVRVKINNKRQTLSNFDIHCFMALSDYKKHCRHYDLRRGLPDVIKLGPEDFKSFDPLLSTSFMAILIDEYGILDRPFDARVDQDIEGLHKSALKIQESDQTILGFRDALGDMAPADFLNKSREP